MPASKYPGAIQLTRIFDDPNSIACVRVNPSTPDLLAAYADVPATGLCATIDEN
jgi:hypothetical protein